MEYPFEAILNVRVLGSHKPRAKWESSTPARSVSESGLNKDESEGLSICFKGEL